MCDDVEQKDTRRLIGGLGIVFLFFNKIKVTRYTRLRKRQLFEKKVSSSFLENSE